MPGPALHGQHWLRVGLAAAAPALLVLPGVAPVRGRTVRPAPQYQPRSGRGCRPRLGFPALD
eukprot:8523142-Lingulodinium_polyedra.AAC.1